MKGYTIKKGHRYWKYNDQGYTMDINEAKIFTEEDALQITNRPYSDKTMHEL